MVGNQQCSFVIVLADINTIRFALHTLMMFEIMSYVHLFANLPKLRNRPADGQANARTQTAHSHLNDVDFVCPSCFCFIFPSFLLPFVCHRERHWRRISGDLKQSDHTEGKIMPVVWTKCLKMGHTMDDWQGSRKGKKKSCKIIEEKRETEAAKCTSCREAEKEGASTCRDLQ